MKEITVPDAEEKTPVQPEAQGIQIPPKALKLAKSVGIDLEPLVNWGLNMDARVTALGQAVEQLGVKLTPLVQAIEQRQQQMKAQQELMQQNPQAAQYGAMPQMQGMNPFAFLSQLGLGGGGGDSEVTAQVMKLALESMSLGNSLMKAVIIKTAPEIASNLIGPIAAKKAEG